MALFFNLVSFALGVHVIFTSVASGKDSAFPTGKAIPGIRKSLGDAGMERTFSITMASMLGLRFRTPPEGEKLDVYFRFYRQCSKGYLRYLDYSQIDFCFFGPQKEFMSDAVLRAKFSSCRWRVFRAPEFKMWDL